MSTTPAKIEATRAALTDAVRILQDDKLTVLREAFPSIEEARILISYALTVAHHSDSWMFIKPSISLLKLSATFLAQGPNKTKLHSAISILTDIIVK